MLNDKIEQQLGTDKSLTLNSIDEGITDVAEALDEVISAR